MTDSQIVALAEQSFAAAAILPTEQVYLDPAFRPYCEENLCGQYGVNYTCPPDCGTPEEMKQRILQHKKALLLQTIWEISDYSDKKAIKAAKGSHNAATLALVKKLRAEGHSGFPVGASGCALCTPCAKVAGKPCNFPDLCFSCMSAYCVFVRKTVEQVGIEYDCGDGLLAFFGMYVFD